MIPLVNTVESFDLVCMLAMPLALSISSFMSQILYIRSVCWYVLNRLLEIMPAWRFMTWLCFNTISEHKILTCGGESVEYNYHELWHTWDRRHYILTFPEHYT